MEGADYQLFLSARKKAELFGNHYFSSISSLTSNRALVSAEKAHQMVWGVSTFNPNARPSNTKFFLAFCGVLAVTYVTTKDWLGESPRRRPKLRQEGEVNLGPLVLRLPPEEEARQSAHSKAASRTSEPTS
eukprot:g66013.t1